MRGENLRPDSSPWDPEVLAGFCSHLGTGIIFWKRQSQIWGCSWLREEIVEIAWNGVRVGKLQSRFPRLRYPVCNTLNRRCVGPQCCSGIGPLSSLLPGWRRGTGKWTRMRLIWTWASDQTLYFLCERALSCPRRKTFSSGLNWGEKSLDFSDCVEFWMDTCGGTWGVWDSAYMEIGVDRTLGLGLGETGEMGLEKMGISIHLDLSFPGASQEFLLMWL